LTQQWDATFVWKMTNHSSQYMTAVHNWLPSVAPMMSASILEKALSMPWHMRLGGQLQRQVIACLSPRAAALESYHSARREHRGTAQPGLKTSVVELHRYARRFATAARRKVILHVLGKREPEKPSVSLVTTARLPFVTPELRRFLDPETMYSRALYAADGLRGVLSGDDEQWQAKTPILVKIAQVEQLCRELDLKPEADFWDPVRASTPANRPDGRRTA
jgi:hypothetical protein